MHNKASRHPGSVGLHGTSVQSGRARRMVEGIEGLLFAGSVSTAICADELDEEDDPNHRPKGIDKSSSPKLQIAPFSNF